MINDEDSQTRVLTGEGANGLAWAIFARDMPDGSFSTFIRRSQGGRAATSGFMGPKLSSGELVHYWTGQADGTPFFVLARTAPEVQAVIAVDASGAEYPLETSDVIEQFGCDSVRRQSPTATPWSRSAARHPSCIERGVLQHLSALPAALLPHPDVDPHR